LNEIEFRNWMVSLDKNKKVIGDSISRIKRIERELGNIEIDEEYKKDQCFHLLSLFENTGRNDEMSKYSTILPIGKYSLNTYRYAINLYISFLNANSQSDSEKRSKSSLS